MLLVQLSGDIGSQMFQYAVGRNFSLLHDCELLLDCSLILRRLKSKPEIDLLSLYGFNTTLRIAGSATVNNFIRPQAVSTLIRFPNIKNYKLIAENKLQVSSNYIHSATPPFLLKGNFQHELFFKESIIEILSDFTVKDVFKSEIEIIAESFNLKTSIGIVLTVSGIKNGSNQDIDSSHFSYYNSAITYFSELFPEVHFVFFTNYKEVEIKANFKDVKMKVFTLYEGNKDWKNVVLMSKCMHLIANDSAIAWWAACLNKSKETTVIIPESFSFEKPELTHSTKGIVQNWVKI